MKLFRWWLSKKLNALAWAIAPEPHRSNMLEAALAAINGEE